MREICTSGSVGGEGGNILAYPAQKAGTTAAMRSTERRAVARHDAFRCAAGNGAHARASLKQAVQAPFARPTRLLSSGKPSSVAVQKSASFLARESGSA